VGLLGRTGTLSDISLRVVDCSTRQWVAMCGGMTQVIGKALIETGLRDYFCIDTTAPRLCVRLISNAASKEIGEAKKSKDEARAQALMAEVTELKASIPALEAEEKAASEELDKALAQIPNLPLDEVPDGADEHGNVEHHRFGAKRNYPFSNKLKQHFELGEALGQMDFETAAKLSGSRFVVLKKGLARMERALGQFMLDLQANEHGYTEVAPPLLVKMM